MESQKNIIRRSYDYVLQWSTSPHARMALFVIAFVESSFFPIPPDVILIAMCVAIPRSSFIYAAICSVGSVLGGLFGYLIGYSLFETVGISILEFYQFTEKYQIVQEKFNEYGAWFIAVAGFTPLPYKLVTITAGAFKTNIFLFTFVSLVSRAARFFLLAVLIFYFGAGIQRFIDRYFNILSITFFALLGLGFVIVKYLV